MKNNDLVYSVCGMCSARCPIEVTRKNGKPVWLSGNTKAALRGAMCPKGAAGLALLDEDERPRTPLIRNGERGEGRWRECSWEEALDYVTLKLKEIISQHGAKSVLWSERPGPYSDMNKAFMRALGSPNYCSHDVTCSHNVGQAAVSVSGYHRNALVYDYAHCKHLVLQGRNIFEALTVGEVNAVLDAMEAGCKLSAIDVRLSVTACKSHDFLLLRPGSDYAFNLGIIHTLFHENLYDKAYAAAHIDGLEELKSFVQPYTPQWAAEECGVQAEKIVDMARTVAAAAPAVIWHPGWMTSRYSHSFMTCRSAYIINALLGSIGQKGGIVPAPTAANLGRQPLNKLVDLYPAPTEQRADGVGWRHTQFSPHATLLHEALQAAVSDDPYPLRAYFTFRHDPLTALPDPVELHRRLQKMELLVSITWSWSDTAWFSDVVLPISTYLERSSLLLEKPSLKPQWLMRKAATSPVFNTWADWQICSALAQRMGYDKLVFSSIEDIWNAQLQGTGISIEDFAQKGFVSLADAAIYPPLGNFPTPSGKLEMRSHKWTQAGLDTLAPCSHCPPPPKDKFRLVVGRVALHTHSHTQNNPLLAAEMSENVVWLHTSCAKDLDIQDGELIRIEGATGISAMVRAYVTDGIHPEAVFVVHGFGHRLPMELRAYGKGVGDHELMPNGLNKQDALGCALALQEHFVSVRKIQRGTI